MERHKRYTGSRPPKGRLVVSASEIIATGITAPIKDAPRPTERRKNRTSEELARLASQAAELARANFDNKTIAAMLTEQEGHPVSPSKVSTLLSRARKDDQTIPRNKGGSKPGQESNNRKTRQKLVDEIRRENPGIGIEEIAAIIKARTGRTI